MFFFFEEVYEVVQYQERHDCDYGKDHCNRDLRVSWGLSILTIWYVRFNKANSSMAIHYRLSGFRKAHSFESNQVI